MIFFFPSESTTQLNQPQSLTKCYLKLALVRYYDYE